MKITDHMENGVPFLSCDGIPVPHGFSTRQGGVSEGIWSSMNLGTTRGDEKENVRTNYGRFRAAIGAGGSALAMSNQVHGDAVRVVTTADRKSFLYAPEGYEADALVTDIPELTLVVFNADCLPILFYDPVRKVVGAAHAGWRGTALRIAARVVEKMAVCYGCYPGNLVAAIGPGISRCCFQTHGDVPQAMLDSLGEDARPYIDDGRDGTYHVDLKGLNACILQQAGVLASRIAVTGDCTACLPQKYWSHRVTQGERGSMATMISL